MKDPNLPASSRDWKHAEDPTLAAVSSASLISFFAHFLDRRHSRRASHEFWLTRSLRLQRKEKVERTTVLYIIGCVLHNFSDPLNIPEGSTKCLNVTRTSSMYLKLLLVEAIASENRRLQLSSQPIHIWSRGSSADPEIVFVGAHYPKQWTKRRISLSRRQKWKVQTINFGANKRAKAPAKKHIARQLSVWT